MSFGTVAVEKAEGAILAHALTAGKTRLRKGTRIGPEEIALLLQAGIGEIIAAVPAPGDLGEDEAAERIAKALRAAGIEAKPGSTGRVNLHAASDGVFVVDKALVDALNRIDPAITVATLGEYTAVREGQMVATVKIIPFCVAGALVDQAIAIARGREAFAVRVYRARTAALVQTVLPTVKASVLDKTVALTVSRLARSGSTLSREVRASHDAASVAEAINELSNECDLIIVFGASAMCDAEDVIPAAIRLAGGRVERVGMPVDPGNLLVLGFVGTIPVIGAPGCARSPKENGFDWIVDRLMADIDVTDADIAGLGVGGLLMEIASRPQPREPGPARRHPAVDIVVLAAGRSSRMGGPNKLLASFDGIPLITRVASACTASRARSVTVVTGHMAEPIGAALEGLDVTLVHNSDFATGLASSLKTGIAALPKDSAGALIVLGDMPMVTAEALDRLIDAFARQGGRPVIRATHGGERGNPVLLPASLFSQVALLSGDTGARHVIETSRAEIVDLEIGEGAGLDVDTPEAMARAGGELSKA